MLIAKEKIRSNIGEYIIYMYQIEDLIRACKLDKSIIDKNIISQYDTDEPTKTEIRNWYFGLVDLMEEEKKMTNGHLNIITNKINEVYDFHLYILNRPDQKTYHDLVKETVPILASLQQKRKEDSNELQITVDAIYGYYLLKLKKQEISNDTEIAIKKLSKLLATLSKMFNDYENGKFKID